MKMTVLERFHNALQDNVAIALAIARRMAVESLARPIRRMRRNRPAKAVPPSHHSRVS
jgi:hypothetical protein